MELKNMKANRKKIALIGVGVILGTIGVVMLKKKTWVNLDTRQIEEIEIKSYHEDLCQQIKFEQLGFNPNNTEIQAVLTLVNT